MLKERTAFHVFNLQLLATVIMATASFSSNASTQPFSDVSQPGADLERLISSLPKSDEVPSRLDLRLFRIFARSHGPKHYLRIYSYPDRILAAKLEHDILAVSQSTQSVGCDINIPAMDGLPGLELRLYFNPSSDVITVRSMSQHTAVRLKQIKPVELSILLPPLKSAHLQPGTWRLLGPSLPEDALAYMDLCLQPRGFCTVPEPVATQTAGSKRLLAEVEESAGPATTKKQRAPAEARQVQAATAVTHPLLQLEDGQTAQMDGEGQDRYSLTRQKILALTVGASLYIAKYSLRPGQVVAIKALRPCAPEEAQTRARQWMREVSVHQEVSDHVSGRSSRFVYIRRRAASILLI